MTNRARVMLAMGGAVGIALSLGALVGHEHGPKTPPEPTDRERHIRARAFCGCLFADCIEHGAFGYTPEEEAIARKLHRLTAGRVAAAGFVPTDPAPKPPDSTEAERATAQWKGKGERTRRERRR